MLNSRSPNRGVQTLVPVDETQEARPSFGQWLLANAPGLGPLKPPPRDTEREPAGPFDDWTEDDWRALDALDDLPPLDHRVHESSPMKPAGPHGPGNDALGRQSPGSTYVPGRNPMTKLPFRSDDLL